ncbi:alpha/beta hydrolase [Clostridium sp. MSJ-11]|uniref:Alpha/beta hydrolase n=1 Tax=Clostridium mobile TaxID=2841512 RepID=A0ABS6EFE5_9CLOT|nr:alpha/beta hydrolase [Clostridium mobile]MBU5483431.1 alpha/beta hydrolase [Clostridium mobile]
MSYVNIDDYDIYYESYGEGETVIFLNGIMMSALSWRPFLDSFKNYRLILIDFVDQGKSSKGRGEYTQDLHVEILNKFIEELNLGKVNLFGISYGGEVAMRFSLKYKEKLKSLMLANTTCYTNHLMKDIERLWDYAASTYDNKVFFSATMPFIYSHKFYEENNEWLKEREKLFETAFTKEWYDGFRRAIKSASTLDLREEIEKIDIPTLIIGGDLDIITPLPYQEEIYKRIKTSNMVVIKDSGHGSMYEKPSEFCTILIGFLQTYNSKISIT